MDEIFKDLLALTLALSVILAIVWPRTVFLIELKDGEARLKKGKLPARFMNDLSSVVGANQIARGRIAGFNQVGKFRIRFSWDIPDSLKQPFRNLWAIHMRSKQ